MYVGMSNYYIIKHAGFNKKLNKSFKKKKKSEINQIYFVTFFF